MATFLYRGMDGNEWPGNQFGGTLPDFARHKNEKLKIRTNHSKSPSVPKLSWKRYQKDKRSMFLVSNVWLMLAS